MKKTFLFILGFLFVVSLGFGQLLINEVDADQTGTDSVEFIELYDGGAGSTSLDGYVIVLYNGSTDVSYNAYDLDTYSTDANGYFVIGSSLVPNVDYDLGALTNIIQNGADAVALYTDDASSFPNGTAVTTTNLIDALVYDTNDADDPGLLVLLNGGEPQINEDMGGNKDTESMQRSPNGSGGARNTSTYTTDTPTSGTQNPDPPATGTLTRAYTINTTSLDVVYDISMTSVNAGDYTLTGTATITFTGAAIDGTDDTIVHLTGGSPNMVTDLTLDNIDDTSTNLDFYAGLHPISNTNTNNPTGTMLNDYDATFSGIISANDAYNNVWISDASGAYNGVMIYSSSFDALVNVGDWIILAAQRDVYNSLTELVSPILLYTISSGNDPYGPDVISGSDIDEILTADTNPGESWEGQLVEVQNVYVESYVDYDYRCTDDGGTTYFHIGDNVDYHFGLFSLIVGETYQEIVGVVDWYNSGPYYRINPRDNDDQVLPVTLSNFTAQFINDNLTILWTTQSETNNLGWNIYRGETENAIENNTTFCLNNSGLIPGAGTTTEPTDYQFTDEYDVTVGQTYWYWLETVDGGGNTGTYGPATLTVPEEEPVPQLPQNTFLCSNYPNPFNPETKIEFSIKEGENGSLTIYNTKGQLLETYQYEAGEYELTWDAVQYGSGIYFYKLETQSYTETKKMIMLK
jgi:hypothetical protein